MTHDPRQFTEDLRNHLAMHDKRLCFLFGSGTSSAVNVGDSSSFTPLIPGIDGLTSSCRQAILGLGEKYGQAWDLLVLQCENEGAKGNIEDILSRVRVKIEAVGEGETLLGLDKIALTELEKNICSTIAETVNPEIPNETPHFHFASWAKNARRSVPIEVFTLNYDLLFETAFEQCRAPMFDGFVGIKQPFFFPECLNDEKLMPAPVWTRLWKLHGSVNWKFVDINEQTRVVRTSAQESGELILPSHRKYDESRKQPYLAYLDRLHRLLKSDHALLITSGYSFGDDHVNEVIFDSLASSPTVNVIAFAFEDISEGGSLAKYANSYPNLTVIGPNAAVISGVWGEWQLIEPVNEKTHSFMDIAFDSNAMPEPQGAAASTTEDLSGRMRLPDFNWFCRLLTSMGMD